MHDSKLVLYNVEWQILRVSMLSEHCSLGGWTTPEGAGRNLEKLDAYLEAHDFGIEALWRVLNALNAVRMGYGGQGLRGSVMDEAVRVYRDVISDLYKDAKQSGEIQVDIDQYEQQVINDIKQAHPQALMAVYHNLTRRVRGADKTRDELEWFVDLLEEHGVENWQKAAAIAA